MTPGDQQGLLNRVLSLSWIVDHGEGQAEKALGVWNDDNSGEGGFLGALDGHGRDHVRHKKIEAAGRLASYLGPVPEAGESPVDSRVDPKVGIEATTCGAEKCDRRDGPGQIRASVLEECPPATQPRGDSWLDVD